MTLKWLFTFTATYGSYSVDFFSCINFKFISILIHKHTKWNFYLYGTKNLLASFFCCHHQCDLLEQLAPLTVQSVTLFYFMIIAYPFHKYMCVPFYISTIKCTSIVVNWISNRIKYIKVVHFDIHSIHLYDIAWSAAHIYNKKSFQLTFMWWMCVLPSPIYFFILHVPFPQKHVLSFR